MTNLICSVSAESAGHLIGLVSSIPQTSAVWLELRLDLMSKDAIELARKLAAGQSWPTIATCRSKDQGGCFEQPASDQLTLLNSIPSNLIDIEHGRQYESAPIDHRHNILSYHDFDHIPKDLSDLIEEMEKNECCPDVVKIAWQCDDICQNFDALEALAARPGKRIMICMGERGLMSRILAAKVGAFGSFCSATETTAVAPGQLSIREMLETYHWERITAETKFFGVIGSPVGHSLSPALFNAQFEQSRFDGVYIPLLIESEDELLRFLEGCQRKSWLHATGFSVTIPHKESLCRWLGDRADDAARRIGAVNTLHLVGGEYRGFNTDYFGILEALRLRADLGPAALRSKCVTVLGAGGVARAAVAALVDCKTNVTIFNRSVDRAAKLADEFDCKALPWEDRTKVGADLIINCTSVGMTPDIDSSPMPAGSLQPSTVVFDTVYRPQDTALIQAARVAGCQTVGGLEMFIHQAAAQYRIWTDTEPDISMLQQVAQQALDVDVATNPKDRQ